jgi:hypothetical protein
MAKLTSEQRQLYDEIMDKLESNPDVKKEVTNDLVPDPSQKTANLLWKVLTIGLLVLLGMALIGLIYMVGDGSDKTSPDMVLTAFTALLAGLLGLFVKSPTQSGG